MRPEVRGQKSDVPSLFRIYKVTNLFRRAYVKENR